MSLGYHEQLQRIVNKYISAGEPWPATAREIAKEIEVDPEIVVKVLRQVETHIVNDRRQPKLPAPKGGISIREAARKYGLPHNTISYWVKSGRINILERTPNWLYIDESSLVAYLKERNNLQAN